MNRSEFTFALTRMFGSFSAPYDARMVSQVTMRASIILQEAAIARGSKQRLRVVILICVRSGRAAYQLVRIGATPAGDGGILIDARHRFGRDKARKRN